MDNMDKARGYVVFAEDACIAEGDAERMLVATKRYLVKHPKTSVLVFDAATGRQVEFEFRGSEQEMLERELPKPAAAPGPGRPKLGVTSREVSLMPKHWEFLEAEPNGISAALRRLVEDAMKRNPGAQRKRLAREATARFMTTMAGNLPNFEEASRALYAEDDAAFQALIRTWPKDIKKHVRRMAAEIA